MANSSISISSIVINSVISASVAVSTVSASPSYPDITVGVSISNQSINASYFIVPTSILPEQQVEATDVGDGVGVETDLQKDFETFKTEGPAVTDDGGIRNIQLAKTDSVTMVESRVKVFTDFIDFDPSDADVDATPVTVSESAAIDVTIADLADNDDVTVSESTAKNPAKPGITASVSTSEAINQLRPHKNVTDTATTSEAIDRFDVTTVLDDTVTATEAIAKNLTQISTDDVTAVQSNIKAFTSNIDFDLSDADVDPDPVTASDQINIFASTKGLTDTVSATESTAKNFTHGGFNDTASPVESTAFNVTIPGFADSFTAVEGIKLEPNIPVSDTVSATESAVFNIQQAFSNTASVTENLVTSLILGESDYVYPSRVYAIDADNNPSSIRGYHRGLGESGRAFVQDVFRFGTDGREEFVGIIGGAGLINNPQINNDTITYGDSTNAGLLVNFIYTDTDDTELNGHFLNETPLSAGRHT
tara:strand:- start:6367 stop:7803 length:1437 start_codon:yes stop_codon:yes gene_type:complete